MSSAAPGREATAPQRPALGSMHRILGRFHVTGVFWYRLHYWAATTLPLWLQRVVIVVFTAGFFPFIGRIRDAVASNLEPVLGPGGRVTRWRRSYRTFYAFANCLTDRNRRMAAPTRVQFVIEGEPYWREALAGGRGAVIVSAHIGLWELSAHLGAAHERRTVHIVREEEIDPQAQEFFRSVIGQTSDRTVTHFAGDNPALAIELAEALRRGELVALQADRPRAGGRTVMTHIFGRPMPLPNGPVALARAADVPLLSVFSFREGTDRGRAVIRPPIVIERTGDRAANMVAAVQQLAGDLEWAIRERPHQWFCFRKLWD